MYKCSLKAKRLLPAKPATVATSTTDALGVKLPNIDVPRFNGNILSWCSFWEQFDVALHSRTSLSKAEKLAYLQSSPKDGSAKSVINGLSQSGDHYDEAVATLESALRSSATSSSNTCPDDSGRSLTEGTHWP